MTKLRQTLQISHFDVIRALVWDLLRIHFVFAPFCVEGLNLLHQAGKVIKGQNSGLAFTLSS